MFSRTVVLACAALCFVAAHALPETCEFSEFPGQYYLGDSIQIAGEKLVLQSGDISVDTCKNICLGTLDCRGFTFKGTEEGEGKCTFKTYSGLFDETKLQGSTDGSSTYYSLAHSGKGHICHVDLCTYKAMLGTNVVGKELKVDGSAEAIKGSPSYCEGLCKGLESCRGFEWKPSEQVCRFKKFSVSKYQKKTNDANDENSDDRIFYLREQSASGERCEVTSSVSEGESGEGSESASSSAFNTTTFGVFAAIGSFGALAVVAVVVYRKRNVDAGGDYMQVACGEDEI